MKNFGWIYACFTWILPDSLWILAEFMRVLPDFHWILAELLPILDDFDTYMTYFVLRTHGHTHGHTPLALYIDYYLPYIELIRQILTNCKNNLRTAAI